MSQFFDQASLVMIPSGYKTGKVYSQKPLSADGELTFTRSNDTATRVASNGLIERVRTNLLTYSQDFSNAAYNKGTGGSVSANTVVAPDGTTTADAYTWATATNSYAFLSQSVAGTSQIPNTFSIYIKRPAGSGSRTLRLAVTDVTTSTALSSNITVTESWQRFEFTRTSGSSTGYVGIGFVPGLAGVPIAGGEVLDIYAAQLETGDIATDYIATTSAAVSVGMLANTPRLDYTGGATCPKLLLEPQRTNLALYSEQFDNAAWIKVNTAVTANSIVSPDGNANADKLIASAGLSNKAVYQTIAPAGTSTTTVFAKAGEFEGILIGTGTVGAFFNLTTGQFRANLFIAPLSTSVTNMGNGWHRCSVTMTLASPDNLYIGPNDNVSTDFAITGNGTDGIYVYGAQLEASAAYATSYINTLNSAVTRGADSCSKTGISSLIGQTEGVVFFEGVSDNNPQHTTLLTTDRQTTFSVVLVKRADDTILGQVWSGGTSIAIFSAVTTGIFKVALKYQSGNTALFVNGVKSTTNTTAFTPPVSIDKLYLTSGPYFANPHTVNTSQALLFPTALTDAQCIELTSL